MDSRCVPLQHHAIATTFDVPEPGHLVKAATGQGAPIRAPGDGPHFVGMPCERLAHTPAFHIPQLDGPIKAPTGKSASIGGKGQCEHPVAMPCGLPHADLWLHSPHLPQSNASIQSSRSQQTSIGTPGQCVYRPALAGERLAMRAPVGVEDADGGIIPTAGEQVTIGGKGKGLDRRGPPVRPEQIPAFDVPQLESTIPAARGQRASIRAEGEGRHRVGMGLPGQMQALSSLLPYPHLSLPAASCPVPPIATDGHRPGRI